MRRDVGVVGLLILAMSLVIVCPGRAMALSGSDSQLQAGGTSVATADEVVQLGLDGTFGSTGKDAVLKRINEIRLEACKEGVPNPDDPSQKLTQADYVPVKWSRSLEMIARTRAAEASVFQDHTRPNGQSCFSVVGDGITSSSGECLAWNYSGMLDGIEQWYGEKADWVKQDFSAVTGHYTSLISPGFTHVGLGEFTPAQGGWTCVAGEFSDDPDGIDESEIGATGKVRQLIEVQTSDIVGVTVEGPTKIGGRATKRYSASLTVALANVFGGINNVSMVAPSPVVWSSSNPAVLAIDANGAATSKQCGVAVLTASALGRNATAKVTVTPAAISIKKLVAQKNALKVTWAKGAALAKGYEIRYSLKKSMKASKTVKVKGAAKKARVIKKLQPKKRYYVQIRSYAKVGGKLYYSAWSKKKAVKVK